MKNRFIGGVVTPAQPQYLYGMVDDRADAHDFVESPPILGIAAAVGGYKVCAHDQRYVPRFVGRLSLCVCLCRSCAVSVSVSVSLSVSVSVSSACSFMLQLYSGCLFMLDFALRLPANPYPYCLYTLHFTGRCPACPAPPEFALPCTALSCSTPFPGPVLPYPCPRVPGPA